MRQSIRKISNTWAILQQNKLFNENASEYSKSGELTVFCIPQDKMVNGGVISIFTIAKYSREFCKNVLIATVPHKHTYIRNNLFRNDVDIFRFKQIIKIAPHLDKLTLHIPEYAIPFFIDNLREDEKAALANISDMHINIMNQNIDLMPPKETVDALRVITDNITQTVAHHAYATKAIKEKYALPLTLIPALVDFHAYPARCWDEKENLIAYSDDFNPHKDDVLARIKQDLPEYKLIEIRRMTFDKYVETITRAKFTISFGEGFDGYFVQPPSVGSIGVAVYNDRFFPSNNFLNFKNVFSSYSDLIENFKDFACDAQKNHPEIISATKKELEKLYNFDDIKRRVKNFNNKNYDFI